MALRLRRLLCVPLLLGALLAQDPKTPTTNVNDTNGFLPRTITVAGKEHRYAVFVPQGYRPAQRWPLILFLHGMGESGTDGWRQTEVGLGAAIRADQERWPFVVLFPQKPDRLSQWTDHEAMVLAILAEGEATYTIDPKRRFLTGLSQGGAGTWAFGAKHAETWAAIAPVCGYGKLDGASAVKLKAMPIWAFHGVDDPVVPAQQSKDLCAAVTVAGGEPALTLYENTKHNSWDKAYRESALEDWLRLLPAHPVLAAAIADGSSIGEGSIDVRDDWSGDTPPHGRTTAVFTIAGESATWRWQCDRTGDPRASKARAGTLTKEAAQQRLLGWLRALARARCFDPKPAAPVEAAMVSFHDYTVEIALTVRGQRWTWRRALPPEAQLDDALSPTLAAVAAFVREVERLN